MKIITILFCLLWVAAQAQPRPPGGVTSLVGPRGPAGTNAVIAVTNTITTAPGSNAEVTNLGTPNFAMLQFKIPRGADGPVNTNFVVVTNYMFQTNLVFTTNIFTVTNLVLLTNSSTIFTTNFAYVTNTTLLTNVFYTTNVFNTTNAETTFSTNFFAVTNTTLLTNLVWTTNINYVTNVTMLTNTTLVTNYLATSGDSITNDIVATSNQLHSATDASNVLALATAANANNLSSGTMAASLLPKLPSPAGTFSNDTVYVLTNIAPRRYIPFLTMGNSNQCPNARGWVWATVLNSNIFQTMFSNVTAANGILIGSVKGKQTNQMTYWMPFSPRDIIILTNLTSPAAGMGSVLIDSGIVTGN